MVKITHLISKEAQKNKYKNFFKKLYKTIKESISSNGEDIFYSKDTRRALQGHLGAQELEPLRYMVTRSELGHSEAQGTRALRHVDIRTFEEHLGTQALRYSGTCAPKCLRDFTYQTRFKVLKVSDFLINSAKLFH